MNYASQAISQGIDDEILSKFVTLHLKIMSKLTEEHSAALCPILPQLLPFCAELLVSGPQRYKHIPPRLIVTAMLILKSFAMRAKDDIDENESEKDPKERFFTKLNINEIENFSWDFFLNHFK